MILSDQETINFDSLLLVLVLLLLDQLLFLISQSSQNSLEGQIDLGQVPTLLGPWVSSLQWV